MKKNNLVLLGIIMLSCSTQLLATDSETIIDDGSGLNRHQTHPSSTPLIEIYQFDLGKDGSFPFTLSTGFSGPEGSHRWTDGKQATIRIPVIQDDLKVKSILFTDTSALYSNTIEQKLIVGLNGVQESVYIYSIASPTHDVEVVFPNHISGEAEIVFEMPNACCPCLISPENGDPRILAIAFKQGEVNFEKLPQPISKLIVIADRKDEEPFWVNKAEDAMMLQFELEKQHPELYQKSLGGQFPKKKREKITSRKQAYCKQSYLNNV